MSTTEATAADAADSTTDERTDFIKGLRALADFIEQSDGAPVPYSPAFRVHLATKAELAEYARSAGRADKETYGERGGYFGIVKHFGPITFDVYTAREQVCQRVVVGTEKVTEEIPDPEALAEIPKVTVEREREIVEWRCNEPLLAPAREEVAA